MKTLIDVESGKKRIITVLREELGSAWGKLNEKERVLVERCAEDAASLGIKVFASGAAKDAEWRQIDSQLANIDVAAALVVKKAFWRSVSKVFGVLHGILAGGLQALSSLAIAG